MKLKHDRKMTKGLFAELCYFDYQFPEPQYLGAKYVHRGWIAQHVPENAHIVLDALIAENAWNYVQTSWYNNWTSYLIESLFKRHPRVVSAVGEIISVDFFIDNIPIDLKVTYFPSQYMESRLKNRLGKSELSWLKVKAKEVGIPYDKSLTNSQIGYVLTEKLIEYGYEDIVRQLRQIRKEIVCEARQNPEVLLQW